MLVHASLPLFLSVQEPQGDLKLGGIRNNSQQAVDLIRSQLTGTIYRRESRAISEKSPIPLLQVDVCLLADDVREPTANAGNYGQSKHNLAGTINVGIEKTQNVLEIRGLNKGL